MKFLVENEKRLLGTLEAASLEEAKKRVNAKLKEMKLPVDNIKIKMVDEINSFRGQYFFLSNFYPCPVIYEGIKYQNNESAFQANKCLARRTEFATLNPSEAKAQGRKVKLRSDWANVKEQIMYEIVLAKFQQNKDLATKLIATKDAYLEEGNTWGDYEWGTVNGIGKNKLGKLLMRVRKELLSLNSKAKI